MALSLCLVARKPAVRVRALLRTLRPVVDEIVLAADRTGDPAILDACAELADRRFLVDPAPLNRHLGWLQEACATEWIVRFEDDEMPGRALLEALPELGRERRLTHQLITRRWLVGSDQRYVTSAPWQPDYQVRLVRNVPGIWRFPGVLHAPIEVLGERRHLDLPVYHFDCLLAPLEVRRAKRDAYTRRGGGAVVDGVEVNCMYTPEDVPGVASAPVPSEDLGLLAASAGTAERWDPSPPDASPVVELELRDADRHSVTRDVAPGAYAGTVQVIDPLPVLVPAADRRIDVVVTNNGTERWSAGETPPFFRIGWHWAGDGQEGRALLPETLLPGRSTRVPVILRTPQRPGRHLLTLGVVHEHVRWFACTPLELDVTERLAA